MLGGKFTELAFLFFQNLLKLVDLELREFGDGLDDSPLLVAGQRDTAAQKCEEILLVEVGFGMRRNRNVFVAERGSDRAEAVVAYLPEDLNVLVVIAHFLGRRRLLRLMRDLRRQIGRASC